MEYAIETVVALAIDLDEVRELEDFLGSRINLINSPAAMNLYGTLQRALDDAASG